MLGTSARLLRLLTTLQTRRHWSGGDLSERLEVTPRTLRRDVERLRSLGYAVQASSGPGGGYQLGTGTEMPPLLLDDTEAVALAAALRSATDTFFGDDDTVVRVLLKLEELLPKRLRRRVGALQAMTVSVGRGLRVDPELLITLASACRDQLQLDFSYTSHNQQDSRRSVEPLRLAHTSTRRWYLVAWDLAREALRTFRVDRIREPVIGAHFTPRAAPRDLERYVAEAISTAPHSERARVLVRAPASETTPRVPTWLGTVEPHDAESSILTIGAEDLEHIVAHLVFTGLDFELIQPETLRPVLRKVALRLDAATKRAC